MNIPHSPESLRLLTAGEQVFQLPEPALRRWWHVLAPLLALIGGVLGILGALYNEATHGSVLVAYIGAPMIEEMLKPTGVYILLVKWRRALRTQLYTAFLSALGGIAFALIENMVYLNIYVPDPSQELVLWRNTAGIGIHALCSFIYGFGINRKLLDSVNGIIPFFSTGKRYFITAMVLHSLYNIGATIFASRLGF